MNEYLFVRIEGVGYPAVPEEQINVILSICAKNMDNITNSLIPTL